jgi:hypothetical protein
VHHEIDDSWVKFAANGSTKLISLDYLYKGETKLRTGSKVRAKTKLWGRTGSKFSRGNLHAICFIPPRYGRMLQEIKGMQITSHQLEPSRTKPAKQRTRFTITRRPEAANYYCKCRYLYSAKHKQDKPRYREVSVLINAVVPINQARQVHPFHCTTPTTR